MDVVCSGSMSISQPPTCCCLTRRRQVDQSDYSHRGRSQSGNEWVSEGRIMV